MRLSLFLFLFSFILFHRFHLFFYQFVVSSIAHWHLSPFSSTEVLIAAMSDPVDSADLAVIAEAHSIRESIEIPISDSTETHFALTDLPPEEKGRAGNALHPYDPDGFEYPTEEEENTLRRVSDKIPWPAYTVAFVELCERFSYYGTTAVCMCAYRSPN